MSEVRVLVQIRKLRVQILFFDVISRSFCIIFDQKTEEHVKTIEKRCLEVKKDDNHKSGFKKGMFSWRVSLEGFPASFLAKSAADQQIYLIHLIRLINSTNYFD